MSSLFGGGGAAQQPSSTGGTMFGNIGGNASSPAPNQGGGMFGNIGGNITSSAPNQGSGLFSGLGGQKSTATSTSGLFGSAHAPGNSTNTSGGPSFGLSTATTAAPNNSLFGTLGGQTNNNPSTSSNLFASQQQQQQPAATSKPEPALRPEGRQPAYFDQLLERGRKRQATDNGNGNGSGNTFGELPTLQLGLGDIARKVRNLGQGSPASAANQRDQGRDSRSHYLLAASGVNTGAALRDLSALGADAAPKSTATISAPTVLDTDLDGYVEGLYRQSSLNLVEQVLSDAKKDFDDFLEEHVQMEWDMQRRRIYEHFGLAKKGEEETVDFDLSASAGGRGAFGRSSRRSKLGGSTIGLTKSVLGNPSMRGSRPPGFNDVAEKASTANLQPAPEDRMQRDKQDRYAEKVKSLNVSRLEETVYPLLQSFADVEAQPSVEDNSHYVNCFKALAEIVGERPGVQPLSEPGVIKERQFAHDYLDDASNSKKAFELRKRILNGSRSFLEKQFLANLDAAITKNPREANLGGVPTVTNKVRGYVRLKAVRKELGADNVELQTIGDDYVWVLIFYLLRAGLIEEAAAYVTENERAIKSMDRNFPTYIASYAKSDDRRLSPELQNRISGEYTQRARIAPENSLDPYRMACYKIIGRCGLSKRNLDGVNQSMEDWVWLQFALAREVNRVEETASEVFGLEEVRSVIHEIGQRHFIQGGEGVGSQGTYFFLQILAGQFEAAVAWLYPHNYLTAVHFAVALNYYGLLRVNDFNGSDDLLSYTTRQQPQISFGHMIGFYTRDFRSASPTAAADYLTLICLNGDISGEQRKRQTELCHEALRELVLETREFAQLLGDIRSDGQRIKGAIEARLKLIRIDDSAAFLRHITIGAAQIADENGRVTDAVLLYHLAEEYDDVISVASRALSDAIAAEPGTVPLRLEPLKPRANDADTASLSLTAVTDPAQLAANMNALYKANALLYQRVRPANRGQMELLLLIADAKRLLDDRRYAQALDKIVQLNILPLSASGNMGLIRERAASFNALPPLVAKLVGPLLVWTVRCCEGQRKVLEAEGWGPERRDVLERLAQGRKDALVFAGVVRYRLGARVWEALAGEGGVEV
ncbi:NIC-domain-containing protein [Myriangium duriaei CBS 260.36]|uniref:NIC-domain-containing protein n=1 Tax=Myriangium duriaei CBS 260.36 TaxID=1168546 RepID=A0A9P4MGK2_9PEZI|nr:NIC-domain-containing protein [Myriangium duriaei CBS 260.36]